MSDQEADLLKRWRAERPLYDLWGRCICDRLTTLLRLRLGDQGFVNFLKLPLTPRLKEERSFVEKALHRKQYSKPFEETEDKVGIRLVVLLEADLRLIEELLCDETTIWTAEKSRDHELEMSAKPWEFGYQSLHYILRSSARVEFNGEQLQEGMPCEVQIRTLLQHAHSELTHDTLYKPSVKATPLMLRAAAKSMALIEATGDYFASLSDQIKNALADDYALSSFLVDSYSLRVGQLPADKTSPLNQLLIDRYKGAIRGQVDTLRAWLDENAYVAELIKERARSRLVFQLPAILLLYFAVSQEPRASSHDCPLSEADLEPIYTDLGISLRR